MVFRGVNHLWDFYHFDVESLLLVRFCNTLIKLAYNKLCIIVGKPIHVARTDNITPDGIDQLHNEYIQAVEQLFIENKDKYNFRHTKLEII